jgi:hypothetical protein
VREAFKSRIRRLQLPEILRAGDFRNQVAFGSIGGPPVWSMREAYMPSPCTCATTGRPDCLRHTSGHALDRTLRQGADPDGFNVFGRFPKGFLNHVLRHGWLGDVRAHEVLHVCSGTLSDTEQWTVDRRRGARPRVLADGTALPFREASFKAILLDPPYSDEYAKTLYGTPNPRPSHLLREAARVVRPGGRIGLLHVAVPFTPPGCWMVNVYGITTGTGYRIRALTVFEREQDVLPLNIDEPARQV